MSIIERGADIVTETCGDADRDALLRPQPIGLFDGPAALILVPAGDGADALLRDLARGALPTDWPAAAAALEATRRGDVAAALASLGDDRVSAVNRFVLEPTAAHFAAASDVPICKACCSITDSPSSLPG